MWQSFARFGIPTTMVAALASPVAAEPIQIVYRIDVVRQCAYTAGTETCGAYRASFPLTVAFDSDVMVEHGDDLDRTRFYGVPTISDLPLPRRTDFPPLAETLRQAAERARFSAPDGAWLRESALQIREGGSSAGSDYHRDFSLIASGEYPFPPELTAASFARFLGTAPFRQFGFSEAIELASGGFEAVTFYGDVTLEPAPVPEPMSMLLVGTGLGGVMLRRWRQG